MTTYRYLDDLLDESMKEEVTQFQDEYVEILKNIKSQLEVLKGEKEKDAIPNLDYITKFMKKLLNIENFLDYLDQFPDFKKYLLETFLPYTYTLIMSVSSLI